MMASRRSFIWAAPLAITAALALALAPIPTGITARPLCAAVVLAGLMLVAEHRVEADEGWSFLVGLGARLLVGSFLSGAFALLFILAFHPKPSPGNVVWMLGIPILVALGQRRQNLALLVPFVVFGWVGFALLGWALQVPID